MHWPLVYVSPRYMNMYSLPAYQLLLLKLGPRSHSYSQTLTPRTRPSIVQSAFAAASTRLPTSSPSCLTSAAVLCLLASLLSLLIRSSSKSVFSSPQQICHHSFVSFLTLLKFVLQRHKVLKFVFF